MMRTLLVLTLLALAPWALAAQVETPSVNPVNPNRMIGGEMAVWAMDARDDDQPSSGSTRDASGNGRHLTKVGASLANAKFEKGYHLSGRAYLRAGFALPQEGTFTIWLNPGFLPEDGLEHWIVDRGVDVSTGLWLEKRGDNTLWFQTNNGGGLHNCVIQVPVNAANFNIGTWHHVAASWGPTGNSLYLDGVKVGTCAPLSTPVLPGEWWIGGPLFLDSPSDNRYWVGYVDEARVYDRVLTDAEIVGIANFPYAGVISP